MPNFTLIRTVNFKEMPRLLTEAVKQNDQPKGPLLDSILRTNKEHQRRYGKYLLASIREIEDTREFINKLVSQTLRPIVWLKNLEKLVNLNLMLLEGKANPLYLSTFHIFIDEKQQEFQAKLKHQDGMDIRRDNGTYSFKKLKGHLEKIACFEEKKLFLTQCKIEFLQFKPRYIANGCTPFDEKIDLEIQRIVSNEAFRQQMEEHQKRSAIPSIQKIKVNSQLNQFADIFFQMMNEYKIENKPLIETSNANMAKVIAHFFTDSSGDNIEQSTIETYLQKNKPEKRPKEYNRIRLK